MKLATYRDGSRDGQLVVVSRDLRTACYATASATRLQQALDDWNFIAPQLQDLSVALNQGRARHGFPFDPQQCMAPLPRAYQWVEAEPDADGGAAGPALVQGAGDAFLGPCDAAWFGSATWDIDFGAGLAAVTGDVEMGAGPAQGLDSVRLLLLVNSWRLRRFAAAEAAGGAGLLHSRPAAAFGPVAVTPDELGDGWRGGRVHLNLQSTLNGRKVGLGEAGPDQRHPFGALVAQLARTRPLRAGTLVGTGPLRHQDPARGWHCIADQRAQQLQAQGAAPSAYLQTGDRVHIALTGRDGLSVFGAIDQQVDGPLDLDAADRPDPDGA